jgi:hypothetical protein
MDKVETSRKILDSMVAGTFGDVVSHFSPDMAQALSADTVAGQWAQLQQQVGAFKGAVETRTGNIDGMDVVMQMLEFENARLIFRLVYKDGQIVGMHFSPAP